MVQLSRRQHQLVGRPVLGATFVGSVILSDHDFPNPPSVTSYFYNLLTKIVSCFIFT